jgi:site-specific DNA-methyltransferase (adenine-specific)
MPETKSPRNKTIDLSIEETEKYLNKCIRLYEPTSIDNIINKTIIGDMVEVCEFIPRKSIDLLIVDPPYNLTKNYHGNTFKKKNDSEYLEYTTSWIETVMPTLKDTASIYVCCDWKTSLFVGIALMRYFNVINRITWQREKGKGSKRNWKNSMEDIWFATKSNEYTFNYQ